MIKNYYNLKFETDNKKIFNLKINNPNLLLENSEIENYSDEIITSQAVLVNGEKLVKFLGASLFSVEYEEFKY